MSISRSSRSYDFLVVGAGMAGLTAAASAARRGARVLVIEKAPEIGGSTLMSGGMVWTVRDPESLISQSPKAQPDLVRGLVKGFPRLLEWCRGLGAKVDEGVTVLGEGYGHRVDLVAYLRGCSALVADAGGSVATRTQIHSLAVEAGRVVGVEALSEGREMSLSAPWTLLAAGGFQADHELLAEYVHPNAPKMLLRSQRASTGDTLRAALEAGAVTSPGMQGFYGHLVSSPVDDWGPGLFTRISQYHSDRCALINLEGNNFQPDFEGDHFNTQAAVRQPEARALMVMDDAVFRQQGSPTASPSQLDRYATAREHGANLAQADTLRELGTLVAEWGFAGEGVPDAVADFNRHSHGQPSTVMSGETILPVLPLEKPPFYAMEVRPAITFTHGGVLIDLHSRAIGSGGRPVPGLLAAGADSGGTFDGGYAGGLAMAGVTGLVAADTVVG